MFVVIARIRDRDKPPTYGVLESGTWDPLNIGSLKRSVAINYGGSPKDYFIFSAENHSEFCTRAMSGKDFHPIWRNKKIVGLEFIPKVALPKPVLLTRYQILKKRK